RMRGTAFCIRSHSFSGVEWRVQYRKGWSARICAPARTMNVRNSRLRKCWARSQTGIGVANVVAKPVPGCACTNASTDGMPRRYWAAATPNRSNAQAIGRSQTRFNHRFAPIRRRGAMPNAAGTEPAHVLGSMTSSPLVSCSRSWLTTSGDTPWGSGEDGDVEFIFYRAPIGSCSQCARWTDVATWFAGRGSCDKSHAPNVEGARDFQ